MISGGNTATVNGVVFVTSANADPNLVNVQATIPDSPGTKLFGLSGHLNRTECFELPLGITLREVVQDFGGGVRGGKSSRPVSPVARRRLT